MDGNFWPNTTFKKKKKNINTNCANPAKQNGQNFSLFFLGTKLEIMQSTVSVSKGCFVFKNGLSQSQTTNSSLLTPYKTEPWYIAYTEMWNHIETQHKSLQMAGYAQTMAYLRNFITNSHKSQPSDFDDDTNMPTTALLTGINQPDHYAFFKTCADELRRDDTSLTCIIQARDCPNMKSAIAAMVSGLMESGNTDEYFETTATEKHLRRHQYNMSVLKTWYADQYTDKRPILTVIIPDFENFHSAILQQFILLLCHNCNTLPIVLVLGVATDLETLHRTLSFADTSRMNLQVSQSPPSTHYLNKILEDVILTPSCSIKLSGEVFNLLTDIFFCYDLSINSFMQAFKYCVLEHYSQGNAYALCGRDENTESIIRQLPAVDLDKIRRLPSFRKYVESLDDCKKVIAILTEDVFLKAALPGMIVNVRRYFENFYCALRLLLSLVAGLPKRYLGNHLRNLYEKCVASPIVDTEEFKESFNLLAFMNKDELVVQFKKARETISTYLQKPRPHRHNYKAWKKRNKQFEALITSIETAGTSQISADLVKTTEQFNSSTKVENRGARLLQMVKQPNQSNEYSKHVTATLDFLRSVFVKYLVPHSMGPALHELFVFSDVYAVRSHIMGAPRGALDIALNDPQSYLECSCCTLTNSAQMVATLPDLTIVYKLHKECGRMINLYDLLQAFKSIVAQNEDDIDSDHVDPQLQARFTRAIAELQFLGFVKPSKRKTDHVTRLTW